MENAVKLNLGEILDDVENKMSLLVEPITVAPEIKEDIISLKQKCNYCDDLRLSYNFRGDSTFASIFFSYPKHFKELRKGALGRIYRNIKGLTLLYIQLKNAIKHNQGEQEIDTLYKKFKRTYSAIENDVHYVSFKIEIALRPSVGTKPPETIKKVMDSNKDDETVRQLYQFFKEQIAK